MKNGYRTTEFWSTLFHAVLAAVVSILAIVQPGFTLPTWVAAIVPTAALVASSVATAVYSVQRTGLKKAFLNIPREIERFVPYPVEPTVTPIAVPAAPTVTPVDPPTVL